MEKIRLGIVGVGFVGNTIYHTFSPYFEMRLYDKFKPDFESLDSVVNSCKYIFVCVPTPVDEKGRQDKTAIEETMKSIDEVAIESKVLILRSTILPGTTRYLSEKHKRHDFIFCPEFLTERTAILDSINAHRIILGGEEESILKEVEDRIFRPRYPHANIFQTNYETAELAKYVGNCFFAVKVAFMNEVYEICDKLGVDYSELRKLFLGDQRITNSHTEVPGPDGYKGFGGKCLPKDLLSFISYGIEVLGTEMTIFKAADKVNERVREKKDWLDIKGATTQNNYK